jgi:hypothetical protein
LRFPLETERFCPAGHPGRAIAVCKRPAGMPGSGIAECRKASGMSGRSFADCNTTSGCSGWTNAECITTSRNRSWGEALIRSVAGMPECAGATVRASAARAVWTNAACPSVCVCGNQPATQVVRFVGRANRPDEPQTVLMGRQRLGRDASPYRPDSTSFLSRHTNSRTRSTNAVFRRGTVAPALTDPLRQNQL